MGIEKGRAGQGDMEGLGRLYPYVNILFVKPVHFNIMTRSVLLNI